MKAVSNTTPLRYLIAIEQEHLLGRLFEKVFVPEIEQRANQETNIDELNDLIEDAEQQGQLRAYICPPQNLNLESLI